MYIDFDEESDDSKAYNNKTSRFHEPIIHRKIPELIDLCKESEKSLTAYSLTNIKGEENYDPDFIYNEHDEESISNKSLKKEHIIKYESIIEKENYLHPKYAVCDVCLCDSGEDEDELIFCEFCYSAVHQSCYGSEIKDGIPENDWICQRCRNIVTDKREPTHIRCFFCPEMRGIIKTVIPQSNIGVNTNIWAHVSCVNWIKEIYFIDEYKEKAHFVIDNKRYGFECSLCGSILGICIQCDYKSCKTNFHVTCAQRKGLIISYETMEVYKIDPYYISVFCEDHKSKIDELLSKSCDIKILKDHIKKNIKFYDLEKNYEKKPKQVNQKKNKNKKPIKKLETSKFARKNTIPVRPKKEHSVIHNTFSINFDEYINDHTMLNRKKVLSEHFSDSDSKYSVKKRKKKVSEYMSETSSEISPKRKKAKKEKVITMKLDKPKKNNTKAKKVLDDKNTISFIPDIWINQNKRILSEKDEIFNSFENYKIPPTIRKILGYKEDIFMTVNDLNEKFINIMIKSDCYDKEKDYILLYKKIDLQNLFKQELIHVSQLKYILSELLIEYNSKLPQENKEIKKNMLFDSSSDSGDSDVENQFNLPTRGKIEVGWNLGNEGVKIDFSNIHSSNLIVGRKFFNIHEQLRLYKFEDYINLCFEIDD